MEYRRKKTHHYRRKDKSSGGVFVVLLLTVLLLAVAIAFSPLGDILVEKACTPILNKLRGEEAEPITDALAEQRPNVDLETPALEQETHVLTVSIEPYYLLQMGVFDSIREAQVYAAQIRNMGGAGYILSEGEQNRVFAAAYRDLDSLNSVMANVRKDGFETSGYPTDAMSIRITLKGQGEALEVGQAAIATLSSVPDGLCDLSVRFDAENLMADSGRAEVGKLLVLCDETLQKLKLCEDESLDRIRMILQGYRNALSTFLEECDTMGRDLLSAELKALQIEVILQYLSFFQN